MFKCRDCGKVYPVDTYDYKCECGGLFVIDPGIYEGMQFSIEKENYSLWRYYSLLPVKSSKKRVSLGEGLTPLVKKKMFGREVHLKLEFIFPTGSFKDRGAAVLISVLNEIGVKKVVEDSSGNAGASIAAYCAAAGIGCDVYLPASTSEGKIKQIKAYGAGIVKIPGNRDDTSSAVLGAARENYYASHYYNPLFFEGTKTFAFEIWEQMGHDTPDVVIIPVGNGTLLLGAYTGFMELKRRGLAGKIPRILAVQSEKCCPLFREYYGKASAEYSPGPTVAEGIAVGNPARAGEIIEAVSTSGGEFITVDDSSIGRAVNMLSSTGIYVEPTSGAAAAALEKALRNGYIGHADVVAIPLTGHGLKKGT
jgi:threonine synthase